MRRLSPGRILAAVRTRLAGPRYAIEDVLYVGGRFLRRAPGALARGAGAFWGGLGIAARRRLVAALGAAAAMVAFLALAAPNLPCELPGGEECPPPDEAAELVPAEALAYAHLTLDGDRDQVSEAEEILARIPTISAQLAGDALELVPGLDITPADMIREIERWVGDEAALAVLPGPARAQERLWLLAVDDPDGAAEFARLLTGAETIEHEEVEIELDRSGELATAQVGDFLAVGGEESVRGAIDLATGAAEASSVADDEAASGIREELPASRFADVYLSADGAAELVDGGGGALASLAPFVLPSSTRGVGIALSADEGELEVAVRSPLDPDRARAEPGFFGAFAPFEPELPQLLPEDSLAFVGFGDPESTVSELLAQAGAEAPGIARGFEGLARELRRDGEIDIERQLLPALGAEAAFVIEPRSEPGVEAVELAPFLGFVAREVDTERAREALARLQRPVVRAIEPAIDLQAPVFGEIEVAGVEARSLRVSPAIELTHAIVDDLAIIATDPLGVERLAGGDGGLDEAEIFERATSGFPDEVSLLAFLDLRELVSVAERLGLAEDPAYAVVAAEIRSLHALGLAVRRTPDLLRTDARLIVGEPEDGEPSPIAPGSELPPDLDAFPDLGLPPDPGAEGAEPPPAP